MMMMMMTRPRTPQVPHSAIHNLAIHTTRHIINISCVSDSVSISRISFELTSTIKCQKMSPLYVAVTLTHMNQLTTNMAILLPIKNLTTATNIQHTINIQWLQYCNTAALFQCACTTLVHKLRPPCLQPYDNDSMPSLPGWDDDDLLMNKHTTRACHHYQAVTAMTC